MWVRARTRGAPTGPVHAFQPGREDEGTHKGCPYGFWRWGWERGGGGWACYNGGRFRGGSTTLGVVRCQDQVGRGGRRRGRRIGRLKSRRLRSRRPGSDWRLRGSGYGRKSAAIRRRLRGVTSSSIFCWNGGRRCGVSWRGWWRRRGCGGGRSGARAFRRWRCGGWKWDEQVAANGAVWGGAG